MAGGSTAPGSSGATNMPLKPPGVSGRQDFDGISEGLLSDRTNPSISTGLTGLQGHLRQDLHDYLDFFRGSYLSGRKAREIL